MFIASVLDLPDDLTVSLLIRSLLQSTKPEDQLSCTTALNTILSSRPTNFLHRILLGASSYSSPVFLSLYTKQLRTLPAHCQLSANHFVLGFTILIDWSSGQLEREFLRALLRSKGMLKHFCYIIKESDKVDRTPCPGFDTDLLVPSALLFIIQCIVLAEDESPRESEVLVKGLLRAGILEALETVLLNESDKIAEVPREFLFFPLVSPVTLLYIPRLTSFINETNNLQATLQS